MAGIFVFFYSALNSDYGNHTVRAAYGGTV